MILDDITGELIWAPTADQIGPAEVTLRAADPRGGAATQGFTIDVRPNRENNCCFNRSWGRLYK